MQKRAKGKEEGLEEHPDYPIIPAVVKGQTLHHTLAFNFGYVFMSLPDKSRDKKRRLLRT